MPTHTFTLSPATLSPTFPLLPLTLLLGIVLCFLAIHPLLFISHCSASPSVSCLFLSCLSIFAHLPSYNPYCLWLLCKFSHFLSLCLIPSLSFSLSCLPLRQPEYDNVISHSSTSLPSPLFFPPLCLCLFALSLYRLLTLLPSMYPCLSCSYLNHKLCTHMHTHGLNPTCCILRRVLPVTEIRFLLVLPSLPRLLHLSDFLTNRSPPSALSLDIPMPPFFSLTSSSLLHFLPPLNVSPASPSPLHLY